LKEFFQDDDREKAMRKLFDLKKDDNEGRAGIDAFLEFDKKSLPFELKTTSNGSVTTVRDFGADHIEKWKDKHWLIGFFIKGNEYYKYLSPEMMAPWIQEKKEYIRPDFELSNLVSSKLTLNDMYRIIGRKKIYTLEDAKSIQKKQYTKEKYLMLQDMNNGYSQKTMLDILKDRANYLMDRGSTLNNPHIPFKYFKEIDSITENHAEELRIKVSEALSL